MPILDKLIAFVSELINEFSGLTDGQKETILAVGAFIAVLPTLIKGLSGAAKAVEIVSKVISTLASGPIGLLIIAAAALVVAIAQNGDEIQAALQKVDDFLQGIFAKDWTEVFGPILGSVLNDFLSRVKEIWDGIKKRS